MVSNVEDNEEIALWLTRICMENNVGWELVWNIYNKFLEELNNEQ